MPVPGAAGLDFRSEKHHVESTKMALVAARTNMEFNMIAITSPTLLASSIVFDLNTMAPRQT